MLIAFFRKTLAIAVATLTMIILNVCKIQPDHYKVNWVDGWFHVNSVIQDYRWKGDLVVIQYVAQNDEEVVAECMGQDESGHMIT